MKCTSCYKEMILELRIRNKYGIIEKWICKCGKESLNTVTK